ncbi:MAG TPA: Nif3-like dinuclear metal center hexameric protein [Pseudonocardiaceae bacterium]|nr:Nif3-like dinuclear metal center hexameric protein [Pseudonocardiaceae bacterium]
MTATLRDVIAALEVAYPPALAQSWDAVGLVCGDPAEPVHRVLIAVDPVAETVAEALEHDAQLLVTHHPLLLRGVHGVPADDPKGGLVHRLVRAGVGLFCAHTNADAADPGVSDALAHVLGLQITGVLDAHEGASSTGLGRICQLPRPEPLAVFTNRVRGALPETAWGVRAGGDPQRILHTVAVCGGAGDSLLGAASAAGVDAFVTADLRHHPASEHLAAGGPALVDVAHWASEHPWCAQAAAVLGDALGGTVDVHVSYRCTDPWTIGSARPPGRISR